MTSVRAPLAAVTGALVAVQVFFGLHYIAAKYIMTVIPPRAWAMLRIVPAAALLMGFVLLARRGRIPTSARDLGSIALYAVFGVVINQVCFVEGLSRTTTSHSSLINTSIPVATLLFAILLRREQATGRKLTGIALSLAGVLYLIGHTGALERITMVRGDLITLVNALSFSFYLVISRPILSRFSSLAVTAWLLVFGAGGISILGTPELARLDFSIVPASIWGAAAFVILFATIGTYFLNVWALKRVESSIVALFIYLQPLIASFLGWVLLDEPLGPESLISAALIFTGVALALTSSPRPASEDRRARPRST